MRSVHERERKGKGGERTGAYREVDAPVEERLELGAGKHAQLLYPGPARSDENGLLALAAHGDEGLDHGQPRLVLEALDAHLAAAGKRGRDSVRGKDESRKRRAV